MINILFVCHGNICRSPMAEFVMKSLVNQSHRSESFSIASAGTSSEELGNPVYPPVRKLLASKGISTEGKRARKLMASDYEHYDYIVGMDSANIQNMRRLFQGDPEHKVSLLLDYTGNPQDVADPWYTRDFEKTWEDVTRGCSALLKIL